MLCRRAEGCLVTAGCKDLTRLSRRFAAQGLPHAGVLYNNIVSADSSIKLSPAKSILKYQFGDEIRVNEVNFLRICQEFFAEIERKYL